MVPMPAMENHTVSVPRSLFSRVPNEINFGWAIFSGFPTSAVIPQRLDYPVDGLRLSPFPPEKRGMPSCCRHGWKTKIGHLGASHQYTEDLIGAGLEFHHCRCHRRVWDISQLLFIVGNSILLYVNIHHL